MHAKLKPPSIASQIAQYESQLPTVKPEARALVRWQIARLKERLARAGDELALGRVIY